MRERAGHQPSPITFPAGVRKRLGIKAGGVVLLEERNGEVVLRPAAVPEIENYSDEDIAKWDKEHRLRLRRGWPGRIAGQGSPHFGHRDSQQGHSYAGRRLEGLRRGDEQATPETQES